MADRSSPHRRALPPQGLTGALPAMTPQPAPPAVPFPPVERLRPGLWTIPVPLPNNSLRYVFVYVFETDRGAYIVDAGWNTDDAYTALRGRPGGRGLRHQRRPGRARHPHPSRPLRAGRAGSGSVGRVDRAPPRRRRPDQGPLHRAIGSARAHARHAASHGRARTTSSPSCSSRPCPCARSSTRCCPTFCSRTASNPTSRVGAGGHLDAGSLARAPLLLGAAPTTDALGRPRAAPDHAQRDVPPASGRRPARRLPALARQARRATNRPRCCPPTSIASPTSTVVSTGCGATMASGSGRRSIASRRRRTPRRGPSPAACTGHARGTTCRLRAPSRGRRGHGPPAGPRAQRCGRPEPGEPVHWLLTDRAGALLDRLSRRA